MYQKVSGVGRSSLMERFLFLVLIAVVSLSTAPAQNQGSPSGASGGSFLEGAGRWDMEMVREYYKKEYQLDVKAEPDAFPRQEMLDRMNPDFKNRFKAVMAIYQSMGGGELGILPGAGGLRTAESQSNLYKKCRRMIAGTDGQQAQHWQEIPVAERTDANCPDGVVTGSWDGWHVYGMAVDVAWFRNGVFARSEFGTGKDLRPDFASPLHQSKWHLTTDLAGDLGLCPGLWWSERKKDKPHLELHPRLSHAPFPADRNSPRLNGGVAGTALTNDQIQAGYKWKIPEKVFIRRYNVNNPKLTQYLTVYEFIAKDHWIYLKKMRKVKLAGTGEWLGSWTTFEPEIKLFPAWIPALRVDRNEENSRDDVRWRGETSVVEEWYHQPVDSAGKASSDRRQSTSIARFYPDLSVKDRQKEADLKFWRDAHAKEHWVDLQKTSIYDIEVSIPALKGDDARMETIMVKGRQTDSEGYTRNDWTKAEQGIFETGIGLHFGWNRDTGEVGVHDVTNVDDLVTVFLLKPLRCSEDGDCTVVSSQLPGGAFDKETPPDWPPIRKRPEKKSNFDAWKP